MTDVITDVTRRSTRQAVRVPREKQDAPGGGGPYLERRRGAIRKARFDVVVLLEVATVQLVERILASGRYRALERCVRDAARDVYQTTASNVKRIRPVDHSRDGVFLFNFFVADRTEQNIAVWHYTAGDLLSPPIIYAAGSSVFTRVTPVATPRSVERAAPGAPVRRTPARPRSP